MGVWVSEYCVFNGILYHQIFIDTSSKASLGLENWGEGFFHMHAMPY